MQVVVLPRAPLGSRVWTSRLVEKGQLTVRSKQGLCYELTGQFNKKKAILFQIITGCYYNNNNYNVKY